MSKPHSRRIKQKVRGTKKLQTKPRHNKRTLPKNKQVNKTKRTRRQPKMKHSDFTASCLHCPDLKCEVRSTCYDDTTATTPHPEILTEIPEPQN